MKRVLRYLKGTKDFGLVYKKNEDKLRFQVFVDADFAQDKGDRKSRSGHIMMLNKCTVGWSTRKQNSVSVSTAEAEYMTMSECCKDIKWLRLFLTEIGFPIDFMVYYNG